VALGVLVAASGCERRVYEAALGRDTADAYQAFLARYPRGRYAREAQGRLEAIRWKQVRESSSVYALRRFLADFPEGQFAQAARERLSEVRLARALSSRDIRELRRFLTTAPEPHHARAAREMLGRLALEEAMGRGDVGSLQRALEEFGDMPQAERARAALRRRELLDAGEEAEALERFLERYPGTEEAVQARARLAELEARALLAGNPEPAALTRFRERYPTYRGLAQLEAELDARRLRCATAWLDETALTHWVAEHPTDPSTKEIKALLRSMRQKRDVVQRTRELLREALPYVPELPVSELEKRAAGASFEEAFAAIRDLGRAPQPEATLALLDLATGFQFVVAERAMETLLERCRVRSRCASLGVRGRTPRPYEPQGLRAALVWLAAGDEERALRALAEGNVAGGRGSGRILPTVLRARLRLRHGPPEAARLDVEQALGELEAQEQALLRLFPVEVEKERVPEAILAVYSMAGLVRLAALLPTPAAVAVTTRLQGRLRDWEARLGSVMRFVTPEAAGESPAFRAHEARRQAARERLESLALKETLARAAARIARNDEEAMACVRRP